MVNDPKKEVFERLTGKSQEILQSLNSQPINDEQQIQFLQKMFQLT